MEVRSPGGEAGAAAAALLALRVLLQLLPEDGPAHRPECAQRGMQAGVLLTSALLPFSSGSCETENIVGSEMNVSGKFVFPGKNRCAVAAATNAPRPWALLFPTLCPALVLMPQTRMRSTNPTSSKGCSGAPSPTPGAPAGGGRVGGGRIRSQSPASEGCGLRTDPPLPLAPQATGRFT